MERYEEAFADFSWLTEQDDDEALAVELDPGNDGYRSRHAELSRLMTTPGPEPAV